MYLENDELDLPKELDTKIWRYMDFSKFCSMMLNSSLWFTRLDCFNDPYEGYLPYYYVNGFLSMITNHVKSKSREDFANEVINEIEVGKRRITACCFHINPYESEAMWNLYVKNNQGIAIQSTINQLIKCFQKATILNT